jgi:predicted dehydrogenase
MELRYGILSTSSIAPRFIAGVRESGKGQIVALSSRSLEKAKEKAALWDIPTAYGSHEELLQDENVNIVYISNVNTAHYMWAKAALLAGKHVVCEKPCTTTEHQTAELYDLAQKQGLFFMEAQKMLFLPAVLQAKKQLETIGKVTMVALSHSFPGSYNGWMFDAEAGGGPL